MATPHRWVRAAMRYNLKRIVHLAIEKSQTPDVREIRMAGWKKFFLGPEFASAVELLAASRREICICIFEQSKSKVESIWLDGSGLRLVTQGFGRRHKNELVRNEAALMAMKQSSVSIPSVHSLRGHLDRISSEGL